MGFHSSKTLINPYLFESLITLQAPSTEPPINPWNSLQMKYILDDLLEDIRAQNGPSLEANTVARLSDQMDESVVPKTRNGNRALPFGIPPAAAAAAAAAAGGAGAAAAAAAAALAGTIGLTGATFIGAPIAAELLKHGLPHWYQFIDDGTDFANGVIGHGTDIAHDFLTGIDNLADDLVSGW